MTKKMWKQKNGELIAVEDMTTSHIINALAMLKRAGFVGPSTVAFYITCAPPCGDMALLAFEREFEGIMSAPTSIFIDLFEAELKRREVQK